MNTAIMYVITTLICSNPPPPYNDAQQGAVEEARILLAAMSVNDSGLRQMAWRQENYRQDESGWRRVEESRRLIDGRKWVMEQTTYLGEGTAAATKYVCQSNGYTIRILNPRTNVGSIREERAADYGMWNTPTKMLGRGVDWLNGRSLSQVLLSAQDLRVRDGEVGSERIVSGYVEIGPRVYYLEATIDPDRGFAASQIILYDGLLRWPVERMKAEKIELVDGIWIPVQVMDEFWQIPSETAEDSRWAVLQTSLQPYLRQGADGEQINGDPSDPAIRAEYKACIEKVYGKSGIPVENLAPPHRLVVAKIECVNQPPPAGFIDSNLEAAVVVDGLRLHASDGSPVSIGP